jgi:hypothetical protein
MNIKLENRFLLLYESKKGANEKPLYFTGIEFERGVRCKKIVQIYSLTGNIPLYNFQISQQVVCIKFSGI